MTTVATSPAKARNKNDVMHDPGSDNSNDKFRAQSWPHVTTATPGAATTATAPAAMAAVAMAAAVAVAAVAMAAAAAVMAAVVAAAMAAADHTMWKSRVVIEKHARSRVIIEK